MAHGPASVLLGAYYSRVEGQRVEILVTEKIVVTGCKDFLGCVIYLVVP